MSGLTLQLLPTPYKAPVTIVLPIVKNITVGLADNDLYLVNPKIDKKPYQYPYMPPYEGAVETAPDCLHLDSMDVGSPQYCATDLYATARFVLSLWENYLGHTINWWFSDYYPRLELIPRVDSNNAHCGFGYLETGYSRVDGTPFALNFDVIAHEMGHHIVYSELGIPKSGTDEHYYLAFHEAIADATALLGLLHFDTILDEVLISTSGNLYTHNLISRIGKLNPDDKQIRIAPNIATMSAVISAQRPMKTARPLLGMFYDLLVMIFQRLLLCKGIIGYHLAAAAYVITAFPSEELQRLFDDAYHTQGHQAFRETLVTARDQLGHWLAYVLIHLDADNLTFLEVVEALIAADYQISDGNYADVISFCARYREIT